jgi:hypothetical protein
VLNDWEHQRWTAIKGELIQDETFAKYVSEPVQRQVSRSVWHRLHPGGFFGVAVVYMLMAMGGVAAAFGVLLLVCLVGWAGIQVHAARKDRASAASGRLGTR